MRNGESMRMTIVRDIRDRHAAQARIHHMAHHDALTGLPNRVSFMDHLEHSMVGARADGSRLALLFIGAVIGREGLDRQRRVMQMKRFRNSARAQKVDWSAEDKRTMI